MKSNIFILDPNYNKPSTSTGAKNCTRRFTDVDAESQMLLLIQGFEKKFLVSLEEAIQPAILLLPDVEQMVWICKEKC